MAASKEELASIFPRTLHRNWRVGDFIGIDADYVCMCMQCCAERREAERDYMQSS